MIKYDKMAQFEIGTLFADSVFTDR